MPQLFDAVTATQITSRIDLLNANAQPHWGKMNVTQMMAHCSVTFENFFGERKVKRGIMSYLFGKIAKKTAFKEGKEFGKNLPTAREYKIVNAGDLQHEKTRLKNLIHRFSVLGPTMEKVSEHPFFGKLTAQEWATLAYKHLDHHLRQFGV